MNPIELLAPAKDMESAKAAIDCGADAIYMGAPKYGARALAGNSLQDIEKAVRYARRYYARVYATVNTILTDHELPEAAGLIHSLYDMGADGVIVQDMGLLETDLPPIPLIASTQCHNNTWQKVKFLEDAGFQRVILARELSLDQIRDIRSKTGIELETFVHGALCVSFSGQCYLSYANGKRSGNRGVCAQPCRQTYDLIDAADRVLAKDKHLLSLKDLNWSGDIGALAGAGVTSFKIEGRLKDIYYVRNIVAYYREKIDSILSETQNKKTSSGRSIIPFTANPDKTFNRGYTRFFLDGGRQSVASIHTQKSTGETLGRVKTVGSGFFTLENPHDLKNGDGICFFDRLNVLCGMFVTRVEGDRVYPREPGIRWVFPGAMIMRNSDSAFEKILSAAKVERKIGVSMTFAETGTGFALSATDEDGHTVSRDFPSQKTRAENAAEADITLRKQLEKTGGTIFSVTELEIRLPEPRFLPVKTINGMRRQVLADLETRRLENYPRRERKIIPNSVPYPSETLDFRGNVLNRKAKDFYRRHGVKTIEPAAETDLDMTGRTVMTTKHCIRFELGWCPKEKTAGSANRPDGDLYLWDGKRKLKLEFDCAACEMRVMWNRKENQPHTSRPQPPVNRKNSRKTER